MAQQFLKCFLMSTNTGGKFVNSKTLDKTVGKELANKNRTVQRLVSKMVDGTTLEIDLIRNLATPR